MNLAPTTPSPLKPLSHAHGFKYVYAFEYVVYVFKYVYFFENVYRIVSYRSEPWDTALGSGAVEPGVFGPAVAPWVAVECRRAGRRRVGHGRQSRPSSSSVLLAASALDSRPSHCATSCPRTPS